LNRKKIINILKYVWIVAVLIGAGYYFYTNFSEIKPYFSSLKPGRILLSFFMLILGKMLVSDVTRLTLHRGGVSIPYKEALSITAITQLGKYLPGGIWHFAGKFGVYKARGISTDKAARVMIWENGWLLSGAAVVGVLVFLLTGDDRICSYFPMMCDLRILLLVLVPIMWIVLMILADTILFKEKQPLKMLLILFAEQIILWILFGISLWLVFPASFSYVLNIIGAFSISWVAGYAAIFAPGGIGVREFLLATILGGVFSGQQVAAYATIHRLLWVLAEVLLGAASALLFGIPISKENRNE